MNCIVTVGFNRIITTNCTLIHFHLYVWNRRSESFTNCVVKSNNLPPGKFGREKSSFGPLFLQPGRGSISRVSLCSSLRTSCVRGTTLMFGTLGGPINRFPLSFLKHKSMNYEHYLHRSLVSKLKFSVKKHWRTYKCAYFPISFLLRHLRASSNNR